MHRQMTYYHFTLGLLPLNYIKLPLSLFSRLRPFRVATLHLSSFLSFFQLLFLLRFLIEIIYFSKAFDKIHFIQFNSIELLFATQILFHAENYLLSEN